MNQILRKTFCLVSLFMALVITFSSCTKTVKLEWITDELVNDSSIFNDPKLVYFEGVMSQKLLIDDAFYTMNNLMRDPQPENETWEFQLNVQLMRMQRMLSDQYGQFCPVEYQEANMHYLKALENFRFVVENYPSALRNSDITLMEACSSQLVAGAEFIGLAAEELIKSQP